MVPPTVEPDAGDVMVTMRFPGKGGRICAPAFRGRAKEPPITAKKAATKETPTPGDR
jgi:hypothetical protein